MNNLVVMPEFGNKIVAGTGHRRDKIGEDLQSWLRLDKVIRETLKAEQPSAVISGMAVGFDQCLAEAAIREKIPLIAAIPFRGQHSIWPQPVKDRYEVMLTYATKVVYVCEGHYAAYKLQARNIWMVDRCHLLLSLYNGTAGGTRNCLKYAQSARPNLRIVNLWDKFKEAV